MTYQNALNIIFWTFIFYTDANAIESQIGIDNYKNQEKYFELVDKEFTAKKENKYIIEKFGPNNLSVDYHAFLLEPDKHSCNKSICPRKVISEDQIFKITSIVNPKFKEDKGYGDNVCEKNVIFCYYKIIFNDKTITYLQVADFLNAQSPTHALVAEQPWMLQIIPTNPSKSWLKEKKSYDRHFKKSGVNLGYTKSDVLYSQWGKPKFKTKSTTLDMDIEIWGYTGGQLSILDGYVTEITTSE